MGHHNSSHHGDPVILIASVNPKENICLLAEPCLDGAIRLPFAFGVVASDRLLWKIENCTYDKVFKGRASAFI